VPFSSFARGNTTAASMLNSGQVREPLTGAS